MNDYLKISNFKKNEENPFLKEAIEVIGNNVVKRYKTATKTGEKAILKAFDEQTGEVLGYTHFIRQIEVDEEKFTKIYLSNFSSFFDLKQNSMKVFGYILTQLRSNNDIIIFDREDCMKYTGYKGNATIFRGLAQLLENKIIARGKADNLYYINPMVLFNGNRITFAKSYVKQLFPTPKKEINPNQTLINFRNESNIKNTDEREEERF